MIKISKSYRIKDKLVNMRTKKYNEEKLNPSDEKNKTEIIISNQPENTTESDDNMQVFSQNSISHISTTINKNFHVGNTLDRKLFRNVTKIQINHPNYI